MGRTSYEVMAGACQLGMAHHDPRKGRTHHRLYDSAEISLAVHLGCGWRRERAHARLPVSLATAALTQAGPALV